MTRMARTQEWLRALTVVQNRLKAMAREFDKQGDGPFASRCREESDRVRDVFIDAMMTLAYRHGERRRGTPRQ